MSRVFVKYVLSCEQHFSYFDSDYPTSGLTVTGLERVYTIVFQHLVSLVSCLIRKESLVSATSCRARTLLVCYVTTFFYKR
jgi:hypothetical protein